MDITLESKVGEIAAAVPAALRVMDSAGIDYCCGGQRSVREACARVGADEGPLLARLREAARAPAGAGERDFRAAPLEAIVSHLVDVHHAFTREELGRAERLMTKVARVHGGRHGELAEMQAVFAGLRDELLAHMLDEERVLFPYVCALEQARARGERAARPMFGTVRAPVRAMNQEHERAGAALERLRALSGGYAVPADGCASYRSLFDALASLERDLHRHIHLESNVLFPRAIELESAR